MMKKQINLFLLFVFAFNIGFSQKTITGNISDQNGPLPGANIIEQGTNNGVSSDFDGNYQITVEDDSSTIEVSYTGFISQNIQVGSQSSINIILEEDTQQLQEVVVTSLGFKVLRDEQGATSSVINTGAVVRSGEPTFTDALSGKASGVKITRSNADPGAGSTIRIRGANTISGASDPLIIVDGVPMNNQTNYSGASGGRSGGITQGSRINDLNPSDIASVQVLKGSSAAAVWGSRAANGVIVITTKEGESGKAKITYSTSYSFDEVSERIPMQTTWGQGRSGSYGATRAESWGDYIPGRAGGLDTFDTSGQFFTAENGSVYYPNNSKKLERNFCR